MAKHITQNVINLFTLIVAYEILIAIRLLFFKP